MTEIFYRKILVLLARINFFISWTFPCLSDWTVDRCSILRAASGTVQFVQCEAFDMEHACTYDCRKYWTSWKCDKYCTIATLKSHAGNMTNIRQTFAPVSRTADCWRTQPRIGGLYQTFLFFFLICVQEPGHSDDQSVFMLHQAVPSI